MSELEHRWHGQDRVILGHDDLLETISSALLDLRWLIDAVDSGQLERAEREEQGE